jgi:two-component system, NarL family, sensor kinase
MTATVRHEQSVRNAVLAFAITGLVAVLLLGLLAVQILQETAEAEAIDNAARVNRLASETIIAPRITPELLAREPAAIAKMDRAVELFMRESEVVRVKLWTLDGTIIYSDEDRLIGAKYKVGEEEQEVAREGSVESEISDVSGPENRFEQQFGRLLEVYHGVKSTNGQPVLFESYQRFSSIAANSERIYVRFLPAILGALLLLELVQIPLAVMLARRLRDRQRERSALLERAVDASTQERRRLAASLHDGPVQELAGVGFSLAAAAGRMDGEARATVEDAASRTRDTMRDLRTMLVELYPASLHRSGLAAAVSDVLSPLRAAGVETEVDIPADLHVPDRMEALLFRTAREALQNVRKHADATRVEVHVRADRSRVWLTVKDDGQGFVPTPSNDGNGDDGSDGGLGLRLVADLAEEAGGHLNIDSTPGRGTMVRVEVPIT